MAPRARASCCRRGCADEGAGKVFRWATATIPTTSSTTSDLGSAGPIARANGSPRAPFASRRSCAEGTGASVPSRRGSRRPPASVLGRTRAGSSSKRTCRSSEGTAPRRPPGTCGTSSATASRRTARRGVLYGPEGPAARETFEQPRLGERHQFRFIVSPEDARDLDLTDYVRELMKRVECDLGRSIEWAAVNHHDTEHPHAHVIVRGVCREGRQLRMDRAYIARGLRWSAQELATERLGPRLENEIQRTREREVHQERFTSLDREIEHAATDGGVDAASLVERRRGPEPALLARRLEQLESLGFAEKVARSGWVLAEDWQRRLRELGERGDILKQMHRALHGGDAERFHVVRPGQGLPDGQGGVEERTLVGRVVRKGLGDELHGRTFYAVIETPTGDAYHVTDRRARGRRPARRRPGLVRDEARAGRAVGRSTPRRGRRRPPRRLRARRRRRGPGGRSICGSPPARARARGPRDLPRRPGNGPFLPTCSSSSRSDTARRRVATGFPLKRCRSRSTRRSAAGGPSGSTRSMRRVWRRRGSAPRSSPPWTAVAKCCGSLASPRTTPSEAARSPTAKGGR